MPASCIQNIHNFWTVHHLIYHCRLYSFFCNGIEPTALHMLGKHFSTWIQPQPLVLWSRVLVHSQGWLWTHYVADFKLTILLPQLPECCDHRHVTLYPYFYTIGQSMTGESRLKESSPKLWPIKNLRVWDIYHLETFYYVFICKSCRNERKTTFPYLAIFRDPVVVRVDSKNFSKLIDKLSAWECWGHPHALDLMLLPV
jgi:hypothetical protein